MNQQPKRLVVDDAPDSVQIIRDELTAQGYQVIGAGSGAEAVEKARAEGPALILLDVKLPDMDGYQVCQELKRHQETQDIPVIMVTGQAREMGHEFLGFLHGVVGYLLKPVDLEELVAKIQACLGGG